MPRLAARTKTRPRAVRVDQRFLPSTLWRMLAEEGAPPPVGRVAYDTETSGLHVDGDGVDGEGARVATASICWQDTDDGFWKPYCTPESGLTYAVEMIRPGYYAPLVAIAWPFDQGVEPIEDETPKREFKGQGALPLYPNSTNLPSREWRALLDVLLLSELVMHPMKFDCMMTRAGVRRWPGVGADLEPRTTWDTQNVCDLLWPLEKKGLKATHDRLWPDSDYGDAAKAVRDYLRKAKLPAGRWDLVPWEVIGPYATMDARMTKKIELRQQLELQQGGGVPWMDRVSAHSLVDRRMETSRVLYAMERRGLPYDEQLSRKTADQARKVADRLAKKLPFPPKDAKRFFFDKTYESPSGATGLGLVPYEMTAPSKTHPNGQPSLTAEVLGRMVEDGVPYAEDFAVFTKIETAISMWYIGYADKTAADGRLRTVFRQNGTRSSRFSVERINLQAIPHDYRMSGYSELEGVLSPRQIISRTIQEHYEGWVLWEMDLQQAELRIGADMSRCIPMLEMMENGDDLHGYTTRELFSIDESNPTWGQKRQVGKRGNFSLGFGSGARTFREMISKETGMRLEERESQRIVHDWNQLFPEWKRAIDKHSRRVDQRRRKHGAGWIQVFNGERRWFQPYEESHKAFNQRVQTSLAQYGIDWLIEAEQIIEPTGWGRQGAGLILPIHDSLNVLTPDNGDGQAVIESIAESGRRLWKRTFPGVTGGVDVKRW